MPSNYEKSSGMVEKHVIHHSNFETIDYAVFKWLDEVLNFATWCSKKGGKSTLSGINSNIQGIQEAVTNFQEGLKEGGDNPLRQLYDDVTQVQEEYEQQIQELKEQIQPFIDRITDAIANLFLRLKTKVIRQSNVIFNLFKK